MKLFGINFSAWSRLSSKKKNGYVQIPTLILKY